MSQWAGGVLTAAGRTLQSKVEAGTTTLVLTKIKLGDGTESMDAVDNLTDLVGPKAVLGISSSVADGDHATITGVMLSTQLQAGFWCREWGLFARDPDAGEILYMVTIDAQPEWLPASTAAAQVSATYAMNIAVANATNIEVRIDPAGLVDVEMLQSYIGLSKRSTAYAVGDTTLLENIPAGFFMECTTAGTTGAAAPVITPPVVAGQTIADGTVVWTVRKIASTQDLTKYLLLAGGTMTGNYINKNSDDGTLNFYAGTNANTGASIQMNGSDSSLGAEKGRVLITAPSDSLNSQEIRVYPDGSLTQNVTTNGTNVPYDLGGSAIVAKSLGANSYVKRASGEIIQWGLAYEVTSAGATIQFPISFPNNNARVVISPYYYTDSPLTPSGTFVFLENVTGSSFTVKSNSSDYVRVSWMAIGN